MAMGWEFAPFTTIQLSTVPPDIVSKPMCRRAPRAIDEHASWHPSFVSQLARHQVATSCSAMFLSPSQSQLQAASHCSANAHKSLTTQGAKNAQSPITQDPCQHVTVVPNSRRKCLSRQPQHDLFQYRSAQAKRCAQ